MLRDQIGYQIPRRSTASGILALNCLCLLGAAIWLARLKRLEWLAIVVPVITLAATGALVAVGTQTVCKVPATLASAQLIRVVPSAGEAHVRGLMAAFQQRTTELPLGIKGGQIQPKLAARRRKNRRRRNTEMAYPCKIKVSSSYGVHSVGSP